MSTFFKAISKVFKNTEAKPIIVGGWALNYHGHIRNTLDFDVMILETKKNEIKSALEKNGFKLVFENPDLFAKFKLTNENIFEIDILYVDEVTYNKIVQDAKKIQIEGTKFLIPAAEKLIAMKLHSLKNNFSVRFPKDFPDIIALIEINKIDIFSKYFKDLCLKYGNERTYNLIINSKSNE